MKWGEVIGLFYPDDPLPPSNQVRPAQMSLTATASGRNPRL
jgi:hypothetical protein